MWHQTNSLISPSMVPHEKKILKEVTICPFLEVQQGVVTICQGPYFIGVLTNNSQTGNQSTDPEAGVKKSHSGHKWCPWCQTQRQWACLWMWFYFLHLKINQNKILFLPPSLSSLASYGLISLLPFSAKLQENGCLCLLSPAPLLSLCLKPARFFPSQSTHTLFLVRSPVASKLQCDISFPGQPCWWSLLFNELSLLGSQGATLSWDNLLVAPLRLPFSLQLLNTMVSQSRSILKLFSV